MRRLIALPLLLALLVPGAVAAKVRLRVTTPAPGSAVPAHPHVSSLAAEITLRGRARRGITVELRSTCALSTCQTTAVANRHGRWAARLEVVLAHGRRHVRIRALAAATGEEVAGTYALQLPAYAGVSPYADDAPAPQLAVVGDSLAVGTDAPLRAALPGWKVTTDGRVSRPLAEGMAMLAATPLPATPLALAFSLFTNDEPTGTARLEAAVRASLKRLGPQDCAIWATIARPKVGGVSYNAANERLRALGADPELAGRLLIVDWAAAARRHPRWTSADRVHPTADGYVARAQLYAAAALACQAQMAW